MRVRVNSNDRWQWRWKLLRVGMCVSVCIHVCVLPFLSPHPEQKGFHFPVTET